MKLSDFLNEKDFVIDVKDGKVVLARFANEDKNERIPCSFDSIQAIPFLYENHLEHDDHLMYGYALAVAVLEGEYRSQGAFWDYGQGGWIDIPVPVKPLELPKGD